MPAMHGVVWTCARSRPRSKSLMPATTGDELCGRSDNPAPIAGKCAVRVFTPTRAHADGLVEFTVRPWCAGRGLSGIHPHLGAQRPGSSRVHPDFGIQRRGFSLFRPHLGIHDLGRGVSSPT